MNKPPVEQMREALAAKIKELAYEMGRQDVTVALSESGFRRQAHLDAKLTAREFEAAVDDLVALSTAPAATEAPPEQPAAPTEQTMQWRHVKTGGLYEIIAHADLETNEQTMVVYQSKASGKNWVRPASEFYDGRFVREGAEQPAAQERAEPAEAPLEEQLRRAYYYRDGSWGGSTDDFSENARWAAVAKTAAMDAVRRVNAPTPPAQPPLRAEAPPVVTPPDAGHPLLQRLIDSIEVVNGVACRDYLAMYEVRDALFGVTNAPI